MSAYSKRKLSTTRPETLRKGKQAPIPKELSVSFTSLGCAKNLVDSEVMLGLLDREGCRIATDDNDCDIAIVNTCGFIDSSRKESIDEILRLVELKNRGKIRHLIVAGCLAQKNAAELTKEIPEIDAIVGTGDFQKIHLIVTKLNGQRLIKPPEYPQFLYDETSPRVALSAAYSRYVKIAEGCNHTCSFCIIPQMRGSYRSRTVDSVTEEVRNLVKTGLKEACIISQETTYYGRDIDRTYHLPKLLEQLNAIDKLKWIRLFYNHPMYMTREIIESIARLEKVLRYIDIPLQHINDRILKSMNRGVTRERTIKLLREIREIVPDSVLRTTFIVGYPGETEQEFNELCDFVQSAEFDHAGVFTYSREMDVPSGHLPNQISLSVKKDRYKRLMEIQQAVSLKRNRLLIGSKQEVLIEGESEKPDWYIGRAKRHAPEIDGNILVYAPNEKLTPGSFVLSLVNDAEPYDLFSEFLSRS